MNSTRPNRPRRFEVVRGVILSALLPLTPYLLAQSQSGPAKDSKGWDFKVAPYLMMPWMDGTSAVRGHEVEVNLAPSDVFKNLQFGVMGYFEARRGKWGVGADAIYMALGTTVERVPILGDRADADVDFNRGAYTIVGVRELNGSVDLLFGARWNVLHSRIGFKGPQQSVFAGTNSGIVRAIAARATAVYPARLTSRATLPLDPQISISSSTLRRTASRPAIMMSSLPPMPR